MPNQTDARTAILDRIRQQLPPQAHPVASAYAAIHRAYSQSGSLDQESLIHLLVDRLEDYDSDVLRLPATGDVAAAVASLLAKMNETRLAVPAVIDPRWLPTGTTILSDATPLTDEVIESAQAVLTPCEVAVASTGTIILQHGPVQGRRVLTLLPDHHICIVREDQVVETVPEAWARIPNPGAHPLTTISGPSATADIEMTRIRGVHGPRRLSVILLSE
jgi:L-lactate dehydrogenase complex protein LldG